MNWIVSGLVAIASFDGWRVGNGAISEDIIGFGIGINVMMGEFDWVLFKEAWLSWLVDVDDDEWSSF